MGTRIRSNRRALLRLVIATAAAAAAIAPAQAESEWPRRPVTMIVPFPAGGGTDAFARPLAAQFSKLTGQTLVIDNRGGAGGTVGAAIAARAKGDGYTLFMGGVHHAIASSIYPRLDYDLGRDFVPLLLLADVPQVVVVNAERMPTITLQELLALAEQSPGKLNYASAGPGTSHHLAGEYFKLQTGRSITHIPYRGAGPALQDLIAGNVDLMFDGLGSSASHIRAGRIRALLVSGDRRAAAFPEVPSAAELGLPTYNVSTWYGLWAPRGTPPEVQAKIIESMKKVLATEELKSTWRGNGADAPSLIGSAYAEFVRAETRRWADVVQTSGARLE